MSLRNRQQQQPCSQQHHDEKTKCNQLYGCDRRTLFMRHFLFPPKAHETKKASFIHSFPFQKSGTALCHFLHMEQFRCNRICYFYQKCERKPIPYAFLAIDAFVTSTICSAHRPNSFSKSTAGPECPQAETPAEQPAEQPADTQPQEPETPADSGTSDGSTEAPSISLPTQEEVEQAASSLYNAASTILDAIYNAASQNDAA